MEVRLYDYLKQAISVRVNIKRLFQHHAFAQGYMEMATILKFAEAGD